MSRRESPGRLSFLSPVCVIRFLDHWVAEKVLNRDAAGPCSTGNDPALVLTARASWTGRCIANLSNPFGKSELRAGY